VVVPAPAEYVADGAARQAAWALGHQSQPPAWDTAETLVFEGDAAPWVRAQYADVRHLVHDRVAATDG
jgi:xylulokinase